MNQWLRAFLLTLLWAWGSDAATAQPVSWAQTAGPGGGVYLYKLIAGDAVKAGRMILVK